MMQPVLERFLRYVQYDTTSSEESSTCPSTPGQLAFAEVLQKELEELGVSNVRSQNAYVYGEIPATPGCEQEPAIGFIAHLDTAPAASGANVRPRVVEYQGGDIVLNEEGPVVMKEADFPYLADYQGQALVVTDGTTLLGADDKAGVAEIMTAAERLLQGDIPHGKICIAFTPDEEVGRGADLFDVDGFGAAGAYTVDGGFLGELEYENFNAAAATVEVTGFSIHTGAAKGKMINSMSVAMEYCSLLPKGAVPELTEGYEGFLHLDAIQGDVEHTKMQFLIRDHDKALFQQKKDLMEQAAAYLNVKYPSQPVKVTIKDTYSNMKEQILPHYEVIEVMEKAMRQNGVEPITLPIRGGTDGARLSYMGLPCPNICTGGANAHGKLEYAVLEDMEAIKEIIKTAAYLVE